MELDARFELRINKNLSMEIRVRPEIPPDAIADMLADAAATIREGIETMMVHGDAPANDITAATGEDTEEEPLPVEWRYFNYSPTAAAESDTRQGGRIFAHPKALKMIEHAFYGYEITEDADGYTVNLGGDTRVKFTKSGEILSFDGIGEFFRTRDSVDKDMQDTPAVYESQTGTPPAAHLGKSVRDNYNAAIDKATIAATIDDPQLHDRHWNRATAIRDLIVSNYTPEAIANGVTSESKSPANKKGSP